MRKLTVISGPGAGQSLEFDAAVVIGRDGDFKILDGDMSRRHAMIRPTARGAVVEDLGSTNGTFVDGQRITEPVTVTADAKIRVGDSELVLEIPLDTTRIAARPVIDLAQPTRARATVGSEAQAEAAAPPAEMEAPAAAMVATPEAPAEEPPAKGGGPPRLQLALGVLAVIIVAVVLILVLSGGKSSSTSDHALSATVSAVPLGEPGSFLTSGRLDGKPLGQVAVVIQRQLGGAPKPGGPPIPIGGFMYVTAPDGNMSLNFHGTLQLAASGSESLTASGTATNGTLKYAGLKGTFKVTGGRSSASSATASYTVDGNLNY